MDRRRFLAGGAAACLLSTTPCDLLGQRTEAGSPSLSLDTQAPRIPVPADYTGLSYESAQLANPGYFSPDNTELVRLVRQLGFKGVLRLGGSTSDYGRWKPEQVAVSSRSNPVNPDNGQNATIRATVTETAIDELRGFLDATGWTAIYGIDLGHGSPEEAADEAAYVVPKLGPALLALQIGNEPDLFYRDLRPSTYDFDDYFHEWQQFAAAIRRRTPAAPLAGPDVSYKIDWVDRFAKDATGIRFLTSHYYAEGPPESPDSTIAHLLQPNPELKMQMRHLVGVGKSVHLPYRMSEGNSCYNGGKAGVSNVFASALWGADFMLLLARLGVAGVNLHGGGGGIYTPIAGGGNEPYQVRPLYYGMLFYRAFAAGSMIPCRLATGDVNATAYACLDSSRLTVAIVNKDQNRDLHLRLDGEMFRGPSQQMALVGPSVDSKSGIPLGGTALSEREWHPVWEPRNSRAEVTVPHTSALLLRFEGVSL